jgi:hypothetical protein
MLAAISPISHSWPSLRRVKRDGGQRVELESDLLAIPIPDEQIERLDDALTRLAAEHPRPAELVQLRYFGGMTLDRMRQRPRCVGPHRRHLVGVRPRLAFRRIEEGVKISYSQLRLLRTDYAE